MILAPMHLPIINRSPHLFSHATWCAFAETSSGPLADPGAGCSARRLKSRMADSALNLANSGAPSNGWSLFRRGAGLPNADLQASFAAEFVLGGILVGVVLLGFAGWGIYEGVGKLRRMCKGEDAEKGAGETAQMVKDEGDEVVGK